MSPALRYFPAYLGLLAAQVLALSCNTFLDIQYGNFGTEVLLWTIAFSFTLWTGWRQHGVASEAGSRWMRRSAIFGALISVVIFIPMWGFPRAGLYILAALQVSYNCMVTTRRHLHLSLLITLVMVLFAASHYRADWTMLFYLVPYVVAVVFTLVAEQINRKTDELRQQSLTREVVGAQGAAIAAATLVVLLLGWLLYALTPQVTWLSLSWIWGQPAAVSVGEGGSSGGGMQPGQGAAGPGGTTPMPGSGAGTQGGNHPGDGWAFPGEMRQAAARKGMPEWQADAIKGMADMAEALEETLQPVRDLWQEMKQKIKKWLEENRDSILLALLLLAALAMLIALWRLLREARALTWLRSRYDYLWLVMLRMHGSDEQGAQACYEAMTRLFELQDIERDRHRNTREYLAEINAYYRALSDETGELTRLYEDARFGSKLEARQVDRMRELYRLIFLKLAEHS